jgi:hypothetical protein
MLVKIEFDESTAHQPAMVRGVKRLETMVIRDD